MKVVPTSSVLVTEIVPPCASTIDLASAKPNPIPCTSDEKRLGIQTTLDNRLVTIKADVLFLAVKPQFYPSVIAQIKDVVRKDQVIVSIAPKCDRPVVCVPKHF